MLFYISRLAMKIPMAFGTVGLMLVNCATSFAVTPRHQKTFFSAMHQRSQRKRSRMVRDQCYAGRSSHTRGMGRLRLRNCTMQVFFLNSYVYLKKKYFIHIYTVPAVLFSRRWQHAVFSSSLPALFEQGRRQIRAATFIWQYFKKKRTKKSRTEEQIISLASRCRIRN
jgi:hypothetical protein